ncbi:MAG TPA: type II secretion system protein GspG [Thermoanaerobaculia bacterium]|nr:type II secretion system protein GspG [Thermoanaerobaculia bacterium]
MNRHITLFFLLFAIVPSVVTRAAGPYVPTDAERARWTMHDMRSWQIALGAYKLDHGSFPDAKTLEQARDAVQPVYIAHAPMHDAWGNAYRYESDAKDGFRIVSAGADGKFQPETWSTGGRTASWADDAVITGSGRWLFRMWDLTK